MAQIDTYMNIEFVRWFHQISNSESTYEYISWCGKSMERCRNVDGSRRSGEVRDVDGMSQRHFSEWRDLDRLSASNRLNILHADFSTLGSRIEVPVRLFFFGFFPLPVCLIWVYVFIVFQKKELPVCLFGTCMLISINFYRILPNVFMNYPSKIK